MSNIERAKELIEACLQLGVREFCLCAGARNSPLLRIIAECPDIQNLWNFFDERAAGFFAIGRIKETARPVAVITTSGTAAIELLPACVEAYYSGLPLLCITADRPSSYRGTGAPQSIDQVRPFAGHVEESLDLNLSNENLNRLSQWSRQRPLQVNISFDEPMLGKDLSEIQWQANTGSNSTEADCFDYSPSHEDSTLLHNWFQQHQVARPLILLGPMSQQEALGLKTFLKDWPLPYFAEAPSQLRALGYDHEIYSGADFVSQCFRLGYFDSVIRIGGVPTLRLWRDLEADLIQAPVLSVSRNGFSGLSRESCSISDTKAVVHYLSENRRRFDQSYVSPLIEKGQKFYLEFESLLKTYPNSELAFVSQLSKRVRAEDSLYLGNSLPVREWDFAATYKSRPWRVEVNRGANGIDGQISTFLGQCRSQGTNWALLGDLTALYDATAPWINSQLPKVDKKIVIINNSGGRIFEPMFRHPIFINEHNIEFSKWATWWGMSHQSFHEASDLSAPLEAEVIELCPDLEQSSRINGEIKKCLQKV